VKIHPWEYIVSLQPLDLYTNIDHHEINGEPLHSPSKLSNSGIKEIKSGYVIITVYIDSCDPLIVF
jgi:hypothetical protein